MEINNKIEIIKDYIVIKEWLDNLIFKAYPVGTKKQRKDGTYQKVAPNKWVKVKNRSMEQNPYKNLPKDLKQLQPKQEKAILNSMQKDFSTHELKQRSNKISGMIKKQEKALNKRLKEMKKRGIDISKVKTPTLDNLKKVKAMHDKVIQNNLNPQKSIANKKPIQSKNKINKPVKQFEIDPVKMKQIKLPAKFKQHGKNIENMPKKLQNEYKQWIRDNWSKQ